MIKPGKIRLAVGPLSIHFDRGYGIDRRTGWSVVADGRVLSQLEPWLIVALFKAARMAP